MTLENPYQPPAAPAETPHFVFSRDEWFYMAKVFFAWLLVGAIFVAAIVTWQMHLALSQFGGDEYLGRIMALAIPGQYGAMLVMIAAANTLVMVTHRRTKSGVLDPVQSRPWPVIALLTFVTPLMIGWTLVLSLFSSALLHGVPWDQTWTSMRQGVHPTDIGRAMFAVFLGASIFITIMTPIMQNLIRYRGWIALKLLLMSQAVGLVVGVLQSTIRAF